MSVCPVQGVFLPPIQCLTPCDFDKEYDGWMDGWSGDEIHTWQ